MDSRVLDTHIWVWWVHDDKRLSSDHAAIISSNEDKGIGISVISCWEVAKLVEYGRLVLPFQVEEWLTQALAYPGINLLPLTPKIIVESTKLPGKFHKDPADQLIVATARIHGIPLLTVDNKILAYTHVKT
ncbi:twitching motility protein PilT [Achromatium sp. WMS1]|nr:twitching motility protein PilT [Achromatium sp. WMS1]